MPSGAWSRNFSASLRFRESARRLTTRIATRVWDMSSPEWWRSERGLNGPRSGSIPGLPGRFLPYSQSVTEKRIPLPLVGEPAAERRDAARNRITILEATRRLIDRDGIDA